jgi:hypothetical protein
MRGSLCEAWLAHPGKGRSQADMATLEIADIYKNHPLLSEFPVPKFALDEVVVAFLESAFKRGSAADNRSWDPVKR